MPSCIPKYGAIALLIAAFCLGVAPVRADEPAAPPAQEAGLKAADSLLERASAGTAETLTRALDLLGIRYRRGGTLPETGFDCSGFVGYVFREGLGMVLPRTARAISKSGEVVKKSELQPGDLVFFNTMRRTFSHVGIYLGDHLFVHAPTSGGAVRVEDMRTRYWSKRYSGARRIEDEQG
ncbi:MAG: C40 family peptidase [Betaproteobacteria bacterium]|nr:C40 family peptidase [Betaproteobacteria bacterium]